MKWVASYNRIIICIEMVMYVLMNRIDMYATGASLANLYIFNEVSTKMVSKCAHTCLNICLHAHAYTHTNMHAHMHRHCESVILIWDTHS